MNESGMNESGMNQRGMNQLATLMRHLEAYVQEEIGVQGRTLALLEAQEQAVRVCDREALERANRALDAELRTSPERARRRGLLLDGFGKLWSIDSSSLTLSSLIERIGPAAERLQRQRGELRQASGRVARRARRIGAAARAHQQLTREIIETALCHAGGGAVEDGGALVNAEA